MNVLLLASGSEMDWGTIATQVPLVILAMAVAWVVYKQWFVPGPLHMREVERGNDMKDENLRLREALEERILPALIRSTDLTEEAVRVLDSTVDVLGRANHSLGLLEDGLVVLGELREETKVMHSNVKALYEKTADVHDRVLAVLETWE